MAVAREPDFDFALEKVELTRMRRRHLKGVLAIETQVYPRPWSKTLFLSEIAHRTSRSYLVARYENDILGYGGVMFLTGEAHVTNIAVEPNAQRNKVGSRLLLALITEAMANGCDVISLEVRTSNAKAQAMYEKFGFEVVGTRPRYYIETNEDAYIMEVRGALTTPYRLKLRSIRNELDELSGARDV